MKVGDRVICINDRMYNAYDKRLDPNRKCLHITKGKTYIIEEISKDLSISSKAFGIGKHYKINHVYYFHERFIPLEINSKITIL